jgi:hypothetical protein
MKKRPVTRNITVVIVLVIFLGGCAVFRKSIPLECTTRKDKIMHLIPLIDSMYAKEINTTKWKLLGVCHYPYDSLVYVNTAVKGGGYGITIITDTNFKVKSITHSFSGFD